MSGIGQKLHLPAKAEGWPSPYFLEKHRAKFFKANV